MIPLLRYDRRRRRYRREIMAPAWERAALGFILSRQQSRWGRKMRALELAGDPLAMANPDGAPSMHSGVLPGPGLFAPGGNVQTFVPQVCSQTLPSASAGVDLRGAWDKPKGSQLILVYGVGPGSGGGSGRKGTAATVCCGGGGGGSGLVLLAFLLASDLPDEIPLYVPAGGAGGAGVSANDTSGNNGLVPGNYCAFGGVVGNAVPLILGVTGNGGGNGGTAASGAGGGSGANNGTFAGNSGGSASTTGLVGGNGGNGNPGPGGGGAGGGLTSANVQSAGGNGGSPNTQSIRGVSSLGAGAAGGGAGAAGGNGLIMFQQQSLASSVNILGWPTPINDRLLPGGGGAGGGSANSAAAVSGGNGGNGLWGGGGGGGGAATDTTSPQSGAGGNGGDAFLIVVSW